MRLFVTSFISNGMTSIQIVTGFKVIIENFWPKLLGATFLSHPVWHICERHVTWFWPIVCSSGVFRIWQRGAWRARRERAYNRAPGWGVRGAEPPWSWNTFCFWTFNGSHKFAHFFWNLKTQKITASYQMQSHMAILIAYCIVMKKDHETLLNFAILAGKRPKTHLFI